MPVGAGIVAAVGQFLARIVERLRGHRLRARRIVRRILGRRYLCVCPLRRCARRLRRRRRIAPAREDQPRLGRANLVRQGLVPLRLPRLPFQRGDLAVEPRHQVFQPRKVRFGLAQLAFGVAAADVQAADPRRFFQHLPPFGRLGRDDRRDPPLADQGRRMRAGRGIGEGQRDVLRAHVAAVHAIGAAGPALDPAHDLQFLGVGGFRVQHHFGEIARRAGFGAREDHVFHSARPHRLGAVLPHHPADRFEQVGLAAAIGADDPRQPRFDPQFGRFDEALEAGQAELRELHPGVAQRAPARCSAGSMPSHWFASSRVPLRKKVGVAVISIASACSCDRSRIACAASGSARHSRA